MYFSKLYSKLKKKKREEIKQRYEYLVDYGTDRQKSILNDPNTDKKLYTATAEKVMKRIQHLVEVSYQKEEILLNSLELIHRDFKKLNSITIETSWKKSNTWGYNPHTEVTVNYETKLSFNDIEYTTGKASGCGYDKHGASVAQALNNNTVLLYVLARKIKLDEEVQNLYGVSTRLIVPCFAGGGVGMNSLVSVIERLGLRLVTTTHNETFDYYYFERK